MKLLQAENELLKKLDMIERRVLKKKEVYFLVKNMRLLSLQ